MCKTRSWRIRVLFWSVTKTDNAREIGTRNWLATFSRKRFDTASIDAEKRKENYDNCFISGHFRVANSRLAFYGKCSDWIKPFFPVLLNYPIFFWTFCGPCRKFAREYARNRQTPQCYDSHSQTDWEWAWPGLHHFTQGENAVHPESWCLAG
jgi:hypothetical protein